jgi:ubiquinone/menaquinone biosynthesis C-methylase UbiE
MGHIFDVKLANLYEAWQNSYEGMFFDRLSSELTVRLLRPKKGERVLDIGCGTGNHLLLFYQLGLDVTGLDASPYMLDIAKSRFGNKASLKLGSAEDLPFEDNEFDLTTLILTLEFLDNPLPALREAGRVTKNKVFIGALNGLSLGCICKKCYSLFSGSIFRKAHLFTLWGLKGYVKRAYGNMPMEWGSIQITPFCFKTYHKRIEKLSLVQSSPFGTFLGLSTTMTYTLKTDNLKLRKRLQRRTESLIGRSGL